MTKSDNDNLPLPFAIPYIDVQFVPNKTIVGLLDVAKIALGPSMPQANTTEALLAVRALLAIVDRNMPPELQAQDPRVAAARQLEKDLALMVSLRST